MKKTIAFVFALASAAGLFAQGPRGGFGPMGGFGGPEPGIIAIGPRSRTPVTAMPYSGTEVVTTQNKLADGNTITRTQTTTVARDSNGRVYTSQTITPAAATGKQPFTISTIYDPVGGVEYRLDSSAMTATQTKLPPARTGGRGGSSSGTAPPTMPTQPNAPTITTTSLGTSSINGISATGTTVTETIPAGAIGNAQPIQRTRTTWISTQLNIPVQIKTSDPRFGTTDMELTNIQTTEPDAALFLVPSTFAVKQVTGRGFGPGGPGPRGRGGIN
jgi:hypothetical protein